ncbi:MAG TPA: hypothetical protein VGF45_22795 [Polyangia bacterium]
MKASSLIALTVSFFVGVGCGGGDGGGTPAGDGGADTVVSQPDAARPDAGRPDGTFDQAIDEATTPPDGAVPTIDTGAPDVPGADADTGVDSAPLANLELLPRALTTGAFHTCALTAAGAAHCWGSNQSGQLGNPATGIRTNTPVAVQGGLTFAAISAGDTQTCALSPAGKAYCWGTGLELGGDRVVTAMMPIEVVGGIAFRQISAGRQYTCGVAKDGSAHCWGQNGSGELGSDVMAAFGTRVPVKVPSAVAFKFIAAGLGDHTCAITTAGAAWCWGRNSSGQLGNDAKGSAERMPVAVKSDVKFTSIGTGDLFTCGLGEDAKIYCWGNNGAGMQGSGKDGSVHNMLPTAIASTDTFKAVAVGTGFACGLTTAGAALCWGGNRSGQLGRGDMDGMPIALQATPTPVMGGVAFATISAGETHACGVTADGKAHCWGSNSNGELGDGATMMVRPAPVAVAGGITFSAN